MLEISAFVNCCFLCSVIFIEYYSTMHCNEVLQACRVDPIYCDIFGAAERVLRYGLPINLRYIFKRVPALLYMCYIFGKPWVQGTLWQWQIHNTLGPQYTLVRVPLTFMGGILN